MKHLNGPYTNKFSLPGYFAKNGISLESNCENILKEIFINENYEIENIKISFLDVYGNPERHLQYHLISSVFTIDSYQILDKKSNFKDSKELIKKSLSEFLEIDKFSNKINFEDPIDLCVEFKFIDRNEIDKLELVLNSKEAINKYEKFI